MRIPGEWHRSFFKTSFYNPASPAALAKAGAEASFVIRKMKLRAGDRLLDLCCGPGRHAVPLAKKGLEVTGYDLSADYLKEAAERAAKARVKVRFLKGDMRRLAFKGEFDAATSLFTSFGYFRKFSDDMLVLKGAARALRPGGYLLLDIVNRERLKRELRQRYWEKLGKNDYSLDESEPAGDGIVTTRTRLKGGAAESRTYFVRLYSKARISAALRKAGLKPLRCWGGFDGSPFGPGSRRLIVLARRTG